MDKLLWIAIAVAVVAVFLVLRRRKTAPTAPEAPVAENPIPEYMREAYTFTFTEITSPAEAQADVILVAAAIAAYLGVSPEQFTIRSIRRVTGEDTTWSQASRNESVQ